MQFDVIWMPKARISYANILRYLDKHWSYSELEAFRNNVTKALGRISRFPTMYEYSDKNDTHRCVLTRQVSLFYQVKEDQNIVELLVFWDNRQDPEKLTLGD